MGEASPPDLARARLRAARVRGGRDGDVVQGRSARSRTTAAGSSCPTRPRRTAPACSCARRRTPTTFSGTVVVEWLNVSGGVDADPEWTSLAEEIVRAGDVWVGVSAQRIGVEGGPVLVKVPGVPGAEAAGKGLKAIDPARYGSLEHPGDGYSFDIFTQVARALRTGAGLGGLQPQRLIAAGESQSAFALVTYYNGVQPLTHAFDGFFVHSRGAVGLPLVGAGQVRRHRRRDRRHARRSSAPIRTRPCSTSRPRPTWRASSTRTRRASPTAIASGSGRSPAPRTPTRISSAPSAKYIDCGVPINNGPMHIVAKAALRALTTWLATGTAPGHRAAHRRDAGRRHRRSGATPTASRSAASARRRSTCPSRRCRARPGPNPSTICLLLGSTKPFSRGAARAALSVARRVRAALRRRRRRDDQGRLRAPRRPRRAARLRRAVAHRRLTHDGSSGPRRCRFEPSGVLVAKLVLALWLSAFQFARVTRPTVITSVRLVTP